MFRNCLLLTVFTLLSVTAFSQSVGLVLSGGGSKGLAHIGVIKALEEHRVPIDYIGGTSMGAIVGGLYASGMTPNELEELVGSIDWADAFVDNPQRLLVMFKTAIIFHALVQGCLPGMSKGCVAKIVR